MLRTKSRGRQWMVWLCVALAFLVIHVVLSQCIYNTVGWNPLDYRYHRLMLPLVVLFVLVARATRWDGVVRGGKEKGKGDGERSNVPTDASEAPTGDREIVAPLTDRQSPSPLASTSSFPHPPVSTSPLSGEELYAKARALQHQLIPDFKRDGEYLDLLGQSAETGYAPALAKLGEYAMRRAAWVEAYYWMRKARRNGMHGLLPTLREIRNDWAKDGFPDQISNVNRIFTPDAGSIGRALLRIDSGHEAASARDFLRMHHPDYLML